MKILFCNIAWMREYKGINRVDAAKNDPPFGGGSWVDDHGTAHECCNFLSTENGFVYGHVETLSGDKDTQIKIENLSASEDRDYIDGVDVIWTATSPEKGGRRVVGWYRNARVYRYRQEHEEYPTVQHAEDGVNSYRITANKENVYLVEENERDAIDFQLGSGKGWPGKRAIFYPNNHIDENNKLHNFIEKLYLNRMNKPITKKYSIHDFTKILDLQPQVILTGPPGTSKTYIAKQLAISQALGQIFTEDPKEKFEGLREKDQVEIVQFHPSYNYEDFVRGIQVSTDAAGNIAYTTQNRILGDMAKKALDNQKEYKNYVLIIDEINRANLAAVLGELIYALEYRGQKVRTPYMLDGTPEIEIPNNLYIIGTMNTADRSVGHIDYAVRRRFIFIPCLPDKSVLENHYTNSFSPYLKDTALQLFDSVSALFGETSTDNPGYLAPDFFKDDVQVGHTYFMANDCEELAMKFAYQVYPLLREYYKDGILVPGNDDKIEIKEIKIDQEQHGELPLRVDKPEDSQKIFDRIVNKCTEKERSASETFMESSNSRRAN